MTSSEIKLCDNDDVAKSTNKIDKKKLPQDLDGRMTLVWLTKQKEFG
jgi:hypothetical protein